VFGFAPQRLIPEDRVHINTAWRDGVETHGLIVTASDCWRYVEGLNAELQATVQEHSMRKMKRASDVITSSDRILITDS
jgi:hypothetical protein